MAEPAQKSDYISVEEYYEIERTAQARSDYLDGEMFNMSGGTTAHSVIKVNLVASLHNQLKGKPCGLYGADQRVKSSKSGLRIYPDTSVFCDDLNYDEEDAQKETATNPTALFEVLSDSTEAYDRGLKFEHFRREPSLKYYVLIAQDRAHVEVFYKQPDGTWALDEATGLSEKIELPEIGATLILEDLYDRVNVG